MRTTDSRVLEARNELEELDAYYRKFKEETLAKIERTFETEREAVLHCLGEAERAVCGMSAEDAVETWREFCKDQKNCIICPMNVRFHDFCSSLEEQSRDTRIEVGIYLNSEECIRDMKEQGEQESLFGAGTPAAPSERETTSPYNVLAEQSFTQKRGGQHGKPRFRK